MLRLTAEKERLNVVFDQAGTPTYAGDLAMTIFSIVEGGYFAGNEGLYHFSNEGVASWYDFAAEIAAALKEQYDLTVDKKKIRLDEPIKNLGVTEVTAHMYEQTDARFKVEVLPLG